MRQIVLSLLSCSAALMAACSDTTAPAARSLRSGSASFSDSRGGCDPTDVASLCDSYPPPPPSDTSMYGYGSDGSQTGRLAVSYFYNTPGINGWLSFAKKQDPGVLISPNARLTFKNGITTGKGSISISGTGGKMTIDLERVTYSEVHLNGECSKVCATFSIISPNRTALTFVVGGPTPITIIDHGR